MDFLDLMYERKYDYFTPDSFYFIQTQFNQIIFKTKDF